MESGADQAAEGPEGSFERGTEMMQAAVKTTALCAIILFIGCGGGRRPHYYALDIPPAPDKTLSGLRFSGTVAVSRFETPSYLRQGRIVYRQAPEEIGFYEYHRWASEPAETVTTAMIDALRSAQLFSFVKRYNGHNEQDYLIFGQLERLDEIDYGGPVRVEGKVSAELVNLRTGATEWTGVGSEVLTVENRSVNSVVIAMNHTVQSSVSQLVASLDQARNAR